MALHVLASFLSSLWRGTCHTESLRTNTQCVFYLSDQWKLLATSVTAGQVFWVDGGWREPTRIHLFLDWKSQGLLTLSPSPCSGRVNIINWNPNLNLIGQKTLFMNVCLTILLLIIVHHWLCSTWQHAGVAAICLEGLSPAPVWSWHDLAVSVWVSSGCPGFLPHQNSHTFGIKNTPDIAIGLGTALALRAGLYS